MLDFFVGVHQKLFVAGNRPIGVFEHESNLLLAVNRIVEYIKIFSS